MYDDQYASRAMLIAFLALAMPVSACGGGHAKSNDAKSAQAASSKKSADAKKKKAEATDDVDVIEVHQTSDKPLDEKALGKLTDDANEVVDDIAEARTQLKAKKKEPAQAALKKASDALDRILAERPTVDIATKLLTSKRELDLPEVAESVETIPIFASLDRVETRVASPTAIADRKKEREGDKDGASVEEKKTDLAIIDANLVYTEVDLPIASTRVHVLAAQSLVDQDKLDEADELLGRAEGSLEVIEDVDEAPEFQARQLVWDAEAAFARGDADEAKTLLEGAQKVLDPLTKGDEIDPQTKKVATDLVAEITPLHDTLEPGNAEHGAALDALERGLWGLAQRAVARVLMSKRRMDEQFALADALMYLEKAQTDGLYEGSDKAGGSLLLAGAMLKMAKEEANESTKPVIDDLANRAKQLVDLDEDRRKADAKSGDAEIDTEAIELLHESLKFDLRALMFDLHMPDTVPSPGAEPAKN